MAMDRMGQLVIRLRDSSRAGKLAWTETAAEDVFRVSFARHSIQISRVDDRNSQYYAVHILNETGRVIEEVTPHTVDEFMFDAGTIFAELYELARMKARGIDEALADILQELGTDGESEGRNA